MVCLPAHGNTLTVYLTAFLSPLLWHLGCVGECFLPRSWKQSLERRVACCALACCALAWWEYRKSAGLSFSCLLQRASQPHVWLGWWAGDPRVIRNICISGVFLPHQLLLVLYFIGLYSKRGGFGAVVFSVELVGFFWIGCVLQSLFFLG